VFDTLGGLRRVVIAGPPTSGRTSLAKRLFLDHFERGVAAVYVDAADVQATATSLSSKGGAVPPLVFRSAATQYGAGSLETYKQLDPSERVILVDNLTEAAVDAEAAVRALDSLARFADKVIVFGDNSVGQSAAFAPWLNAEPVSRSLEIRPLNHGLRERLAQQWFQDDIGGPLVRTQQLQTAERVLDSIMGRNYVPAFPIYVVAVLQALEEGKDIDVRRSAHGYFYDILIRLALAKGASIENFDIRLAFLAHLAFDMFCRGRKRFLTHELRASFESYQAEHEVGGLEFAPLMDALAERGMLVREADQYYFRYPYLYYYFVATYFSWNIEQVEIRDHVRRLSASLSEGDASDILLFLAHLSSDGFVIDRLLEAANAIYHEIEPATLDFPLKVAPAGSDELTYDEKPGLEARVGRADARDDRDEAMAEDARPSGDVTLSSAISAMKILGQILKNFPGSLKAGPKRTLTKACYALASRCLGAALKAFEEDSRELISSMVAVLREVSPSWPEDKLQRQAERFLWLVTVLFTLGMVKSVSRAVGARELEITYKRVLDEMSNTATRLFDLSLKLEVVGPFPEGQISDMSDELSGLPLPLTVLKLLVLEHFEQFDVERPLRQKACAKLGIRFQALPPVRRPTESKARLHLRK